MAYIYLWVIEGFFYSIWCTLLQLQHGLLCSPAVQNKLTSITQKLACLKAPRTNVWLEKYFNYQDYAWLTTAI